MDTPGSPIEWRRVTCTVMSQRRLCSIQVALKVSNPYLSLLYVLLRQTTKFLWSAYNRRIALGLKWALWDRCGLLCGLGSLERQGRLHTWLEVPRFCIHGTSPQNAKELRFLNLSGWPWSRIFCQGLACSTVRGRSKRHSALLTSYYAWCS